MIRTMITPDNKIFPLNIPEAYIGKQVEILLYATEEIKEETTTPKNSMADFWGILSDETAIQLHNEVKQNRADWEDRIGKQF
jgi:hypothetical protein